MAGHVVDEVAEHAMAAAPWPRAQAGRPGDWATRLYHLAMKTGLGETPRDVAQIRLDNAMLLFDEFVRATATHADAATLRGLERRFAERLQIQPSYWSQIKGRSRQIGERLARQFEQLCHKPRGWMDELHPPATAGAVGTTAREDDSIHRVPQDDDERFIVGLVLTYYRRHPQRARARLLDLLGEVLAPAPAPPATTGRTAPVAKTAATEEDALWERTRTGVAPLKPRR